MFSKTCKYAIRSVLFLAVKTDTTFKIRVEELSEELDIPKNFLAKVLHQLTKFDLISSTKGPKGGFYLNQKNKSTSLLSVIESFDGKTVFTDCILGLDHCSNENPCPYHHLVDPYKKKLLHELQNESIASAAARIASDELKLKNLI